MSSAHSLRDGGRSLYAAHTPAIPDRLVERLRWSVLISLIVNLTLWRFASGVIRRQIFVPPRPIEVTRVIIDRKGHKTEKVVTHKEIKKRVAQAHRAIRKTAQRPLPIRRRVASRPKPRPPGAHNRVLAALPDRHARPNPSEPTVMAGGNAAIGKPIEQQNPGNAVANPPAPAPRTVVQPQPAPGPSRPAPAPPHPAESAPVEAPKPAPPPPPAPKVEPPKPKGPTREAQAEETVQPEIPDDLKQEEFRSFVRVRVIVDADGSSTPELRTSSGNAEIDRRVLEALRRWRWKPALRDGDPVRSTQLFKFDFQVH